MDALIKWALAKADQLPSVPGPFLVAFFIIFVLMMPTILRALKAKPEEHAAPQEVVPQVLLDAGSVYTVLINIQLEIGRLHNRIEMIETMLRRRQKRTRKPKA